LLRWLKDDNSAATIRDLTDVCEQLVPITAAEPARRLFWVAAATLDALGQECVPDQQSLKQALAKVEREIKRLAEGWRRRVPQRSTDRADQAAACISSPTKAPDVGRIGEIRKCSA
jgi:chemosensory pili system protein ChpA (sensor histidine kinase/response regulator)